VGAGVGGRERISSRAVTEQSAAGCVSGLEDFAGTLSDTVLLCRLLVRELRQLLRS
jgi:hypothetical protein